MPLDRMTVCLGFFVCTHFGAVAWYTVPTMLSLIGLFLLLAGFIVGLGAVTVIDLHGFLGRRSRYWTEATTRTHKVTKPLIWLGMTLLIVGGAIWYRGRYAEFWVMVQAARAHARVVKGQFLSFRVSPYLLEREKKGKQDVILPASWQRKITASFLVSVVGWWGLVVLTVLELGL